MSARLLLAGSGEFTPAMREIDAEVLAALPPRARVAIVPTAAGREDTPPRWATMGGDHFRALGAEPVALMVLTRADAQERRWVDAAASVDWFYFSGGDPGHLVETLEDTPFWSAVMARARDGAVLAGSSAGAMMLGETTFVPRDRGPDGLPRSVATRPALGLVPRVIVAPHFDILPERLVAQWASVWPGGHRLLAIDEDTALVRLDGDWRARGRGRVQVFRSLADVSAYASGDRVEGLADGALP